MTNPPNIDAIIAELSEATGPSRELDFLIAEALADDKDHWQGCRVRQERWYEMSDYKAGDPIPVRWEWSQPAYTSSLDAAMTLVPGGWEWECGGNPACGMVTAPTYNPDTYNGIRACVDAATPALALCIAALRVRSALIGEVGRDG